MIDVGFWRADTVEDWDWSPRNARLRFWKTPTNRTHRIYRGLIADLVVRHVAELKQAYEQGARDGVLQYVEFMDAEESNISPETRYFH